MEKDNCSYKIIKWFKDINNKDNSKFIQMNIMELLLSIAEETFDDAIAFAKTNINISNDYVQIIKHSRKFLLFQNTETWKRKPESCFDVTMGSHDSAEVCDLQGYLRLSHSTKHIIQSDVGL